MSGDGSSFKVTEEGLVVGVGRMKCEPGFGTFKGTWAKSAWVHLQESAKRWRCAEPLELGRSRVERTEDQPKAEQPQQQSAEDDPLLRAKGLTHLLPDVTG